MTDGGPVDATNTLIYYVYEQGFVAFNAGRAAAAAHGAVRDHVRHHPDPDALG